MQGLNNQTKNLLKYLLMNYTLKYDLQEKTLIRINILKRKKMLFWRNTYTGMHVGNDL